MTFQQFASGLEIGSYHSGVYGDGIYDLQQSLEPEHSYYPPYFSYPLSPNASLNGTLTRNSAYSSISEYNRFPFASESVAPNVCQKDQWADLRIPSLFGSGHNGSGHISNSNNLIYDQFVMQKSPVPPVYLSSCISSPHRECIAQQTAGHQFSDGHLPVSQIQHSVYNFHQKAFRGFSSSMPCNYSINGIIDNIEVPPARTDDRSMFSVCSSLLPEKNVRFSTASESVYDHQPHVFNQKFTADRLYGNTRAMDYRYSTNNYAAGFSKQVSNDCATQLASQSRTEHQSKNCAVYSHRTLPLFNCTSYDTTFPSQHAQWRSWADPLTNSSVSAYHSLPETHNTLVMYPAKSGATNWHEATAERVQSNINTFPCFGYAEPANAASHGKFGQGFPTTIDDLAQIRVSEMAGSVSSLISAISTCTASTATNCINWERSDNSSSDRIHQVTAIVAPSMLPLDKNTAEQYGARNSDCQVSSIQIHESVKRQSTLPSSLLSGACDNTIPVSANQTWADVSSINPGMQSSCTAVGNNPNSASHSLLQPNVTKHFSAMLATTSTAAIDHTSNSQFSSTGKSSEKLALLDCLESFTAVSCNVQTLTSCPSYVYSTSSQSVTSAVLSCSDVCHSHCPPVTVTCSAGGYQQELQRLMHMTPDQLQHESALPKYRNMLSSSNSQCVRFQKNHHTTSETLSQICVHCSTGMHNPHICINSQNSFVLPPSASHFPPAVECNRVPSRQAALAPYRRVRSVSQLDGISPRKHGTYSVPAARLLLQQLKQSKLTSYTYARNNHRHLLSRLPAVSHLNSSHAPTVIDLTEDEADDSFGETCESIFARVRHRDAQMQYRCYMRLKLMKRNSLANVLSNEPKDRLRKNMFPVDRSLPFHRCFVQKLMRNFKFSLSGLPAKVYPELLPPPIVNTKSSLKVPHNSPRKCVYDELQIGRQPVVVLKQLEKCILDQITHRKMYSVQSNVTASVPSTTLDSEYCISPQVNTLNDVFCKVQSSKCEGQTTAEHNCGEAEMGAESGGSNEENVQKESGIANVQANKWRQQHHLLSLCRPLSVVMERLSSTKISQLCRQLLDTDRQNTQKIKQLDSSLFTSNCSWTVTRIPRHNSSPILRIHMSLLAITDNSQENVKKNQSELTPHQRLKCFRTGISGSKCNVLRKSVPCYLMQDRTWKQMSKKLTKYQKLRNSHSALPISRKRNSARHRIHHFSAPATDDRLSCEMSSRCIQYNSEATVFQSGNNSQRMQPKLIDDSLDMQSLNASLNQDASIVPSEFFSKSIQVAKVPVMEDLAEDDQLSGSDTIDALSPQSSGDDVTIMYRSPVCDQFDEDESTQEYLEQSEMDSAVGSSVSIPSERIALDDQQELKVSSLQDPDAWNRNQVISHWADKCKSYAAFAPSLPEVSSQLTDPHQPVESLWQDLFLPSVADKTFPQLSSVVKVEEEWQNSDDGILAEATGRGEKKGDIESSAVGDVNITVLL